MAKGRRNEATSVPSSAVRGAAPRALPPSARSLMLFLPPPCLSPHTSSLAGASSCAGYRPARPARTGGSPPAPGQPPLLPRPPPQAAAREEEAAAVSPASAAGAMTALEMGMGMWNGRGRGSNGSSRGRWTGSRAAWRPAHWPSLPSTLWRAPAFFFFFFCPLALSAAAATPFCRTPWAAAATPFFFCVCVCLLPSLALNPLWSAAPPPLGPRQRRKPVVAAHQNF